MHKIKNPVIPGMAPDPSIIRVGNKYFIATSTFHWTPAIEIFESTDFQNWQIIGHVLNNDDINLKGTPTPAGVWAPNLSYDEKNNRYWIAYSHMMNMGGREFNADSFAVWADSIHGPWSKPIYLTSIGFDPSLFHDEDGKTYITILEWEYRSNYQAPGRIVIAEFDVASSKVVGAWHSLTSGFTTRGAAEAPIIYKKNGFYYLIIAAGGTGYAHGVEIGRSKSIFGPYEAHPSREPILTSSPAHLFSKGNPDAGQFDMYNPDSKIQKSGHGSLVQTANGEWYMAHLMSRPLLNKKLNPLGRETGVQKMHWTEDNWLEMADGTNLAKELVDYPKGIIPGKVVSQDINEYFKNGVFKANFLSPYRFQNSNWVNAVDRLGYLRIYGGESLFSQMSPSVMATRATSFQYSVETELEFSPDHYSETAGIGLYYDSNNWLYVNLHCSESKNCFSVGLSQAKLGEKINYLYQKIDIPIGKVQLKILYKFGFATVLTKKPENDNWDTIVSDIDVTYLSDEGVNGEKGEIGGFTGLFNFLAVTDSHQRNSFADFKYYKVIN